MKLVNEENRIIVETLILKCDVVAKKLGDRADMYKYIS